MMGFFVCLFCFYLMISFASSETTFLECRNERECFQQTLISNQTIICMGYESCADSPLIEAFDVDGGSGLIYCAGDASCSDSDLVFGNKEVACTGTSCAYNVNNITVIGKSIDCYAANGCAHSTISSINSDIRCEGEQSCANSIISNSAIIIADGLHSLKNSVINATINYNNNSNNTVSVYLYGYQAGYNLTINCKVDIYICNITCLANACQGTVINVYNTSVIMVNDIDSNLRIQCNDTDSVYCPTIIYNDNGAIDIQLQPENNVTAILDSLYLYQLHNTPCNDSNSYACDNQSQCFAEPLKLSNVFSDGSNDEDYNICCRSSGGCSSAPMIFDDTFLNGNDLTSKDSSVRINEWCSGEYSCSGNTIIYNTSLASIHGTMDLHFYCMGAFSCLSTVFNISSNYHNSNNSLVYCAGATSCRSATVVNVNTVYCAAGQEGCQDMQLYGVSNVYLLGTIDIVPGVYDSADINSVDGSKIYSDGLGSTSTRMNVYILVDITTNALEVYCNENDDQCYVECGVNGACTSTYVTIYCDTNINGYCIIYCDPSIGIECPNIIFDSTSNVTIIDYPLGDDKPTSAPSSMPTAMPTTMPTGTPTNMPTIMPTVIPTGMPTEVPTAVPSKLPSEMIIEMPTEIPTQLPSQEPTSLFTSTVGTMGSTIEISTTDS